MFEIRWQQKATAMKPTNILTSLSLRQKALRFHSQRFIYMCNICYTQADTRIRKICWLHMSAECTDFFSLFRRCCSFRILRNGMCGLRLKFPKQLNHTHQTHTKSDYYVLVLLVGLYSFHERILWTAKLRYDNIQLESNIAINLSRKHKYLQNVSVVLFVYCKRDHWKKFESILFLYFCRVAPVCVCFLHDDGRLVCEVHYGLVVDTIQFDLNIISSCT